MAKKDKQKDDADPKADGGKGKGKGQSGEPAPYSSIATHPRAFGSVRRARATTGLIAFAVGALLSVKAQVPMDQVGLRALAAGCGGYMLAWWASMKVWRHLMLAEQKAAIEELNRRRANANAETASGG